MGKAITGRFIPKNPGKYIGNPNNIFFRSSWEFHIMKKFDTLDGVLRWGSEEIVVPYVSPIDKLVHRYYPDFIVVYKDAQGVIQKEIIEVKPLKETMQTERSSERDKAALKLNNAKWDAAIAVANKFGMKFRVLTEASIFASTTKIKRPTGNKSTRKNSGPRSPSKPSLPTLPGA